MPFYDLKCKCGSVQQNGFHQRQENRRIRCPKCGNNKLETVYLSVNVVQSRKNDKIQCPNIDRCGGCCHHGRRIKSPRALYPTVMYVNWNSIYQSNELHYSKNWKDNAVYYLFQRSASEPGGVQVSNIAPTALSPSMTIVSLMRLPQMSPDQ